MGSWFVGETFQQVNHRKVGLFSKDCVKRQLCQQLRSHLNTMSDQSINKSIDHINWKPVDSKAFWKPVESISLWGQNIVIGPFSPQRGAVVRSPNLSRRGQGGRLKVLTKSELSHRWRKLIMCFCFCWIEPLILTKKFKTGKEFQLDAYPGQESRSF